VYTPSTSSSPVRERVRERGREKEREREREGEREREREREHLLVIYCIKKRLVQNKTSLLLTLLSYKLNTITR
jgi:hypothetical protein